VGLSRIDVIFIKGYNVKIAKSNKMQVKIKQEDNYGINN